MRARAATWAAGLLAVVLLAGCSDEPGPGAGGAEASPSATGSSEPESGGPTESGGPAQSPQAETQPRVRPVSVPGLDAQRHVGDRLRLGRVRERTGDYTSYDVSYRSRSSAGGKEESFTISGVLNVPAGPGPFPAVVLAHGYIDPAVYERGQGMTRERGYLATRGYIALHVDYRNHAESDDDPRSLARLRLGYSVDVINAVKALRRSREVPVDDDRIGFMGRSMGGGVVLKALVAEPGLVRGAALWASVSSLEADNYRQFIAGDPAGDARRRQLTSRYGTPEQNPRAWRENSSRPYFDKITEPVLMLHGRYDDTCPPRWAAATQRALVASGVESELEWYDDGHAFGPAFNAAMDRTLRFLDTRLGGPS